MNREIIWGLFSIPVLIFCFNVSPAFGVIVTIIVGLGTFLNVRNAKKKEEEINERQSNLYSTERQLEGFSSSQKYVSNDLDTSIMLDEANRKFCIIYSKLQDKLILDYKDILESEIIEDGNTITKTSRSSQIGGALLGGMLLGGVGAIIGGLSGQKKSEEEVVRVDLKIVVNNTNKPVHIINFLNGIPLVTGSVSGMKKDNPKYKEAIQKANHWHGLISVLIRQADEMDKKAQVEKNNNNSSISVVDELKKLSDLFKEGSLTEQEFKELKESLLQKK